MVKVLPIIIFAFTVFALVDCIRTLGSRVRAFPKWAWALLIVLIPPIGGVLWLVLGKERADLNPVHSGSGGGAKAPDDDPEFLRRLGADAERNERIRELEARLAELDDGQNNPTDK